MSGVRTYPRSSPRKRSTQSNPTITPSSPSVLLRRPPGFYSDTKGGSRLTWRPSGSGCNILSDTQTRRPATLTLTEVITDSNFGLTQTALTSTDLHDLKLSCIIERPPSRLAPGYDVKWDRARRELRNIISGAPRPLGEDGWDSVVNERALMVGDGFKLQFPFTGTRYNILQDRRYAEFLDEYSEDLQICTWDDPTHDVVHECDVNPLPLFNSNKTLITPENYGDVTGRLVRCEFQLHQFIFTRGAHVFFARIERIRVVEPSDLSVTEDLSQLSVEQNLTI